MLNALFVRYGNDGWTGSESAHVASQIRRMEAWLASDDHPNVHAWLQEYLKYLRSRREGAEFEEERTGR